MRFQLSKQKHFFLIKQIFHCVLYCISKYSIGYQIAIKKHTLTTFKAILIVDICNHCLNFLSIICNYFLSRLFLNCYLGEIFVQASIIIFLRLKNREN